MWYPPDCHKHILIAGYPGRRQSKTTVTDDERGSIILRNSATVNQNAICKIYWFLLVDYGGSFQLLPTRCEQHHPEIHNRINKLNK